MICWNLCYIISLLNFTSEYLIDGNKIPYFNLTYTHRMQQYRVYHKECFARLYATGISSTEIGISGT